MYFEVLVVDFETQSVVESAIGDEVFSGAQVVWDKLPREETRWVLATLSRVAGVWAGAKVTRRLHLVGTRDGEAGRYDLNVDDQAAPEWDDLSPAARLQILEGLGEILATVNGLLEIV